MLKKLVHFIIVLLILAPFAIGFWIYWTFTKPIVVPVETVEKVQEPLSYEDFVKQFPDSGK